MTISYTGELNVEPKCFTLSISQMIVDTKQVTFDCHGRVIGKDWPYSIDGIVAVRHDEGYYKAYKTDQIDEADILYEIYILKAKCSADECDVEGFWYEKEEGQDPAVWRFSGYLDPF